MEQETRILSGLSLRLVQIVCVLLVGVKLAHWSFAGVFMDEAYYWMWAQHPALSYYDHPPLNAWLLWLSSALFGWNVFALRLPVALGFAADMLALWLIARRLGGDWQGRFWLTALLFLATPIFTIVTNYALPDHILLTALLFSIAFFVRFFADRAAGHAGATRDLLLGAMFLGLGGLAKYNAAFLGIGLGLYVLLYDRTLLGQGRFYVAATVALALQAPVIAWNAGHDFASYAFQLGGRHAGLATSIDGLVLLLLGILVLVGPFLIVPIGRFAARDAEPGSGFARTTFLVSTAVIVALSLVTAVLFHWNLVAYAAMLPFLALHMRPRWLLPLHALWGTAMAIAFLVNYSVVPVTRLSDWKDEATAWSYDWSVAAQMVETARKEHGAGFVAGVDYTTASLLGFALADRDVVSLDPAREQFDFWFDAEAHKGEDAIIYADRWRPITRAIERRFESIEEIGSNVVRAQGRPLYRQRIYLAKGYKP